MVSMEKTYVKSYIQKIEKRLDFHFDVHYDHALFGETFDLYAYHKNNFFKSFITKSTVYEGYSVFEHILIRAAEEINDKDVLKFQEMLRNISPSLSNPNKFHKKSVITGILISNKSISENSLKLARNFFYRKTYKLSLNGWSETQMALVSLENRELCHPKNKKDIKTLLAF